MSRRKSNAKAERDDVLEYLNTVGIRAAAEAAVAVCRDPKASPQAKATAATTILRATAFGGFGKGFSIDPNPKEPHEMTPEERAEALQRIRDEQDDGEGGGAFD